MTQETPGPECWGCPHLGETEALTAQVGSREKQKGSGAHGPGWWVSREPPPGASAYSGEGLFRAPLAVLLGVGAQTLCMAGKILGGAGPPQLGAHPGLSQLPQHATQGPPTGLHSAGTSPELMEPETSDHNIQPRSSRGPPWAP